MTQFHTVVLCVYVADSATFLASNSVGTLSPLKQPGFFKLNIAEFVLLHQYCNFVFEFVFVLQNYIVPLLTLCMLYVLSPVRVQAVCPSVWSQ